MAEHGVANSGRDPQGRSFSQRLLRLDRRILFLGVILAVTIPLIWPIGMPILPTKESKDFYAALEALPPGSIVLFSFDYEADTRAELDPMSTTVWRYCFRRGLRIVALTLYAGGPGIAEPVMRQAAAEFEKTYGVDYVFLGYNPDWSGTMLRLGESFRKTYPTDQYGRPVTELPLMQAADSYRDTPLLVSISSSTLGEYWAIWAGGKYGQKMVTGNTAIQAAHMYPYYQTRQVLGFLGGLKGAAEFEKLTGLSGDAARGMDAQSIAHGLMVVFILMGNVAFLLDRRRKRVQSAGESRPSSGGS